MNAEPTPTPNPASISAALISVGGTPGPILHVLRHHRPPHVWYFCSSESRSIADAVQRDLDWHPQARFLEVERFEELGPCYRELRRRLPEILRETRVPSAEVLVDYTAGTKTMSAALVLAAIELFQQFSYVGGQQREKSGLGIVVDGKERVLYQDNPWAALALREVERAMDLWAGCQFEAAAGILRNVAPRVPQRLRFEAIASLADAMAARHRLDFNQAKKAIDRLQGCLPPLFDGREDHGLLAFAKNAQTLCTACSGKTPGSPLLRELLDNALRTAGQSRFEDAAARLYRAMELQGQLWLADATDRLFVMGRCKPEDTAKIPDAIRSLPFFKDDPHRGVRLSLEEVFRALAALHHPRATVIVADLDATDPNGKTISRWRGGTEKRNASILAHGVTPIGSDGFEQMKHLATELLDFDLAREANPIPPLDPRWLD